MKQIERLKDFLEKHIKFSKKASKQTDWKYICFEELVLQHGIEMKYNPLPKNIGLGVPQFCYYNCLELLTTHKDLTYCEGFGLTNDLPLPLYHSWLVDSEDKVVDPTWEEGDAYLGVKFNTKWYIDLLASRNRKNCISVFQNNYIEDFSLLREGLSINAILR